MSALNALSILFAQRAGELDRARAIFLADARTFVEAVRTRLAEDTESYSKERIRLTIPLEVECEGKAGSIVDQSAVATIDFRFRRRTRFIGIAEVRFGVVYDHKNGRYVWSATLTPNGNYSLVDNVLWRAFRDAELPKIFVSAEPLEKTNAIRFLQRELNSELTADSALSEIKKLLDFLTTTTKELSEAVGAEDE